MKKTLITLFLVFIILFSVYLIAWNRYAEKFVELYGSSQYSIPEIQKVGSISVKKSFFAIGIDYEDAVAQPSSGSVELEKVSLEVSAFRRGFRIILPKEVSSGDYSVEFDKNPEMIINFKTPVYNQVVKCLFECEVFDENIANEEEKTTTPFTFFSLNIPSGKGLIGDEIFMSFVESYLELNVQEKVKNEGNGLDGFNTKMILEFNDYEVADLYYDYLYEKIISNGKISFNDSEKSNILNFLGFFKESGKGRRTSLKLYTKFVIGPVTEYFKRRKGEGSFYNFGLYNKDYSVEYNVEKGASEESFSIVIDNYDQVIDGLFETYSFLQKINIKKVLLAFHSVLSSDEKEDGVIEGMIKNIPDEFRLPELSEEQFGAVNKFLGKISSTPVEKGDFRVEANIDGDVIKVNGNDLNYYGTEFIELIKNFEPSFE